MVSRFPPFPLYTPSPHPNAHLEWASLYEYTADLLCLEFCRPSSGHHCQALMEVRTPLRVEAWDRALASHPDKAFDRYISHGLRHGFRIGFNRCTPLRSATSNMVSAHQHPTVIREYICKELSLGRMLEPFPDASTLPPPYILTVLG